MFTNIVYGYQNYPCAKATTRENVKMVALRENLHTRKYSRLQVVHRNYKGQETHTVFLDDSKAFDVVNHKCLLYKLYKIGIQDQVWLTIHKYYSTMQSEVTWEGSSSLIFNINKGVRQGGILIITTFIYHIYWCTYIKLLRRAKLGVTIIGSYTGMLAFADDVCLMPLT